MNRMVIIKNTTEEVETMDTEQYYDVNNTMLDHEAVMKVQSLNLDRTASEVNGVKTLVVNNLVRETRLGYYRRKDKWVLGMFEDHNHRMATTMSLNAKTDYISDLLGYRSVFEVSFMEKYKVRHCRLDYIAVDPGG